jgi:hypothetical protein
MRRHSLATTPAALCVLGSGASFDVLVSGREDVTVTDVAAANGTVLQTVVHARFVETKRSASPTQQGAQFREHVTSRWLRNGPDR